MSYFAASPRAVSSAVEHCFHTAGVTGSIPVPPTTFLLPTECLVYFVIMVQQGAGEMSVRSTVTAQFEQVAAEQKRKLAPLTDDLRLLDSGLDSLSFALIVMRLEEALGFDPFDVADDVRFPVTFADFVKLYEGHPVKSGS